MRRLRGDRWDKNRHDVQHKIAGTESALSAPQSPDRDILGQKETPSGHPLRFPNDTAPMGTIAAGSTSKRSASNGSNLLSSFI